MAAAERETPRLNVGVLIAHSPATKPDPLERFVKKILRPTDDEIEEATGVRWKFTMAMPVQMEEGSVRHVADFLEEATMAMVEGHFDMVIVVTDVSVASQDNTQVFGSFSRTARIAVLSTRHLVKGGSAEEKRTLDSPAVVRNGVALMLHLLAHLTGVVHQWRQGDVMNPFRFVADRDAPRFTDATRRRIKRKARKVPDQKVEVAGFLTSFVFHFVSAFRNLGEVLVPVLRGRAFRIPFAMTAMLTAALIPTLVLVFTAEIWDVGFNMSSRVAVLFALVTILAGAVYLGHVHNLYFPRKEKETLTEHTAVVNAVVFLGLIQALIALFVAVALFVWLIEVYVFPEMLMAKWTALEGQEPVPVTIIERLRLAVFISTLATLTGALAGSLDNRLIVRHFALFSDRA